MTEEDRILWSAVALSARPLKGRQPFADIIGSPAPERPTQPARQVATSVGEPPAPVRARSHEMSPLDRPTREKLSSGRLDIGGRVDLHGMTQEQAHGLLLSFLARAQAGGVRHVLVITGKGTSSGGEGVLRRAVPAWLSTPPFRQLVSGHAHAARRHGGEGAIYLRLRRMGAR
jgi:DNA-nicking Smr family endonuclease